MRPPTNVVSVSPGFSRSCLAVMTAQQPEPPLSQGLLLTDGAVVACYSISCSMVSLFQSEEYLEPPVITVQDVIDIAYAFDNAAALVVGWMIASAVAGASSVDWFGSDHGRSPIGLNRVLPAWLLGWPLGSALKLIASLQFARWTALATGTSAALTLVDAQMVAMDGAGLLLVIALWRTWLLTWANRW